MDKTIQKELRFSLDGIVVIAGDLFEKEEDLKDDKIWMDAGE